MFDQEKGSGLWRKLTKVIAVFSDSLPVCSVVTNIGLDHMDEYRDLEDLQETFLEHLNQTASDGLVVACGEDVNLGPVLKKLHRRVVTYGLEPEDWYVCPAVGVRVAEVQL